MKSHPPTELSYLPVDLVNHHLEIDRVSGIQSVLCGVWHPPAELDTAAVPAVMRKLVVAVVAGSGPNDVVRRWPSAAGHEVEHGVVVERPHVEFGQVPVAVDGDAVRSRSIESGVYLVSYV